MKQFRLLFSILTLWVVGSITALAETVTYTFTDKSFADATQSWTATTAAYGFDDSKGVQRTEGTAVATTKTEISNITKISISAATTKKGVGTYSVKVGDSEVGSKSLSKQSTLSTYTLYEGTPISGKVAITMNCTANSLYLKSVTIETSSASCTTPAFTIEDKTITLSEAETGDYDLSANLTINKGGSTGAITYSCDSKDVDIIDSKIFQSLDAGNYTINATMAADDTYCEATASFRITVSSCTAPEEALTLSLSQETADLGQDGTAQVTFSTTGGNGAEVVYSVSPETGAAINGTTATFTKAGTYTLTSTQPTATTGGTTYCGGSDSKTITVTATPVLYFTTTPADPIEFAEVECGGNTPLSQKQQISVQGYNLTGDVAVTVTGDYKIARTASAALEDYAISLTLPKTNSGSINSTYTTVYVLSTPPRTE